MMMNLRSEERTTPEQMPDGDLFHPESDRYYKVLNVINVSQHGIGLFIDGFLERGERVAVGFKHGRAYVQTYGFVAWCKLCDESIDKEEQPQSYMMGLHFN